MNVELSNKWRKLSQLNIPKEKLGEYDVLVLPENFDTAETNDGIWDAQDAIRLSKLLKQNGVKCANSYDLNLEVDTLERRSHDIWLGEVFILKEFVIPIVTGVISGILVLLVNDRLKKRDKRAPSPEVHLEFSVKKVDTISSFKYSGDPETLLKIINALDEKKGNDQISDN